MFQRRARSTKERCKIRSDSSIGHTGFLLADAHAFLGLAYAGLGEAASAIAEGQKAIAIFHF